MLFTRLWMVLLAAVAGLSIVLTSFVRAAYEHDRESDAAVMLTGDRKVIEQFLRYEARTRLDDLAPVSSNPALVTLMVNAARRTDDRPATIGTAISSKLLELNSNLGPLRGEILVAVDVRGVIVGQVSPTVGDTASYLGGITLVDRAINGYVRDDVWEIGGRAYRMSARPIISQGQYYVGAIVHGMEINDRFAQTVAQIAPGASVVVFSSEGPVGAFVPVPEAGANPSPQAAVLADQFRAVHTREDWRAHGATDAIAVPGHTGLVVYGALPGLVGAGGGGFAVGRALPTLPFSALLHPSKQDLKRVPWPFIFTLVFGSIALGMLFMYREFDAQRSKLAKALGGLKQEGNDRLDPLVVGGFARELAVATNDGIDEVVKREIDRAAGRRRSMGELENMLSAVPSQPQAPRFPDMPGGGGGGPPPPPPNAMRTPGTPPPNVKRPVDEDDQPTNIAKIPPEIKAIAPGVPGRDSISGMTPAEELKHWHEVFEQFVKTRKECGEPTDSLAFEKFTTTLQRHKDQLVAKTQCRSVRFQVYVKDGKATLKASPVR